MNEPTKRTFNPPATLRHEIIWGREEIAYFLNCTVERFDRIVKTDAPIRKRAGKWVSTKTELTRWITSADYSDSEKNH